MYVSRNTYVLPLAVPYFWLLFADLPTRRPTFIPRLFSLGFVVDKVALIQDALHVLQILERLSFKECFIQEYNVYCVYTYIYLQSKTPQFVRWYHYIICNTM